METQHVAGYPILSDPCTFKLQLQTPGHNDSSLQPQSSYLSFAPPEVISQTPGKKMVFIWCSLYISELVSHSQVKLIGEATGVI